MMLGTLGKFLGSGLARGFGPGLGLAGATASGRRRRRRKVLTQGQRNDLLFIKDAVGKTAAANYLNLLRGGN